MNDSMSILLDIGVNLFAAFIGFAIGWLWQWIGKEIKLRRVRRFWKPFTKGALRIVVGRFSEFESFEQSGFLGIGDAIGLAELRTYFDQLGFDNFEVAYADRMSGDLLNANLILLGGPDANSVTKEAVSKIRSTIQFGNPEKYEIAFYDSTSNKVYAPRLQSINSRKIANDYGIIFKTENPFSPDKQIIIIAGSFGYGTWAGAKYILSKSFIENPIVKKNSRIECLITTDIVRETPQNIQSIILRELK